MNETIKAQLNHRSIRAFKNKRISKDNIKMLLNVANHTSTSMGMQTFSIIRITDKEVRARIAEVCNQDYVKEAPEFWIFIVDAFRNAQIAKEQGKDFDSKADMDRFFQGFTDATLAAQNTLVAIESMGMGGGFFGSILNDSKKIIEILDLPKYTFPVLGLGFGKINQDPLLKPRMDLELKVFENGYKKEDSYLESIREYDERMTYYYDLRNPGENLPPFSKQVVNILSKPSEKRSNLLRVVKEQGFIFNLED